MSSNEVFMLTLIKSGTVVSQETFGIVYMPTFTQEQIAFLIMLNDHNHFIDSSEDDMITNHFIEVLNSFTLVKMADLSFPILVTGYGTIEICEK